jgi:hypothetical protein
MTQFGHEYAPQNAPRVFTGADGRVRRLSDQASQLDPRGVLERSKPDGQNRIPCDLLRPTLTTVSRKLAAGGFARIGDIIPTTAISKRRLRQLQLIQLIREQRDSGTQELAFHTRPFVLCGIPLRRPPASQAVHTRRNGRFFLHITGHPQFGLPFGQDRLIPIWVATLALRQKSREIHFDSAGEMLDFFQLAKDGPHYRRIIQSFRRIFGATIFFGTEGCTQAASLIDWARFHFFDRVRLWFNTEAHQPIASGEQAENVILLSDAFYREIDEHRIPVEREVIAALAHAPGMLDFYVWLVWKTWTLDGACARIPLTGRGSLKEQFGVADYPLERTFRLTLRRWLRTVRTLWPLCPATIAADGHALLVCSSKLAPAIRA